MEGAPRPAEISAFGETSVLTWSTSRHASDPGEAIPQCHVEQGDLVDGGRWVGGGAVPVVLHGE
jgi:hypothetical protein